MAWLLESRKVDMITIDSSHAAFHIMVPIPPPDLNSCKLVTSSVTALFDD